MKNAFVYGWLILGLYIVSCKKYVQQQEYNTAVNIITNGTWYVQQYLQDTTDITATLSAYKFQFKTDGTVTGTNGAISVTGTWQTDIPNRTITSSFPAGSGNLNELDGVWKITDSSPVYVVAHATINSNTDSLRLQKN